MTYFPTTDAEEKELLLASNVKRFSDLINIIPKKFRISNDLGIGKPLSEIEIEYEFQNLCKNNISNNICFLGSGVYDHFIPKAVDFISSRSEYYTAYTPYQSEVSQGTLQYLYEYQTMICDLTGMDISNASLYDAASAVAEACMLAFSATNKSTILYSSTINTNYIKVMKTCLSGQNVNFIKIPEKKGITDTNFIKTNQSDDIAAVIIQSPNSFGIIENWAVIKNCLQNYNSLLIALGDPSTLSVLKCPGDSGADIYIGDGQTLGNPMNYGGPLLGIMAIKDKYKRMMPGRIVGKTVDKNGKEGFVLTLQTREQHIRREKATSNICTNQGLLALRATIYLALMGKHGLPYINKLCYQKSHYAAYNINKLSGYSLKYGAQFLKEFVIETKYNVEHLTKYCSDKGFLIQNINNTKINCFKISVTEKRTKTEIDNLIQCLKYYR